MSSNFQTLSNKFTGIAPSDDEYLLDSHERLESDQLFKELDLQMSSDSSGIKNQNYPKNI